MQVFSCVEYGDTSWLVADPSTRCYTLPYWIALGVAMTTLALFTITVPVVAVTKVHANRSLLSLEQTSRWLGMLYFE